MVDQRPSERTAILDCPTRCDTPPADPCVMVIFGGTGDLTKRLLMPALYNLSCTRLLPDKFAVIGIGQTDLTTQGWRDWLYDSLKQFASTPSSEFQDSHIDVSAWKRLAEKMTYISGDLTGPGLYKNLSAALADTEKAHGTAGNVLFYLAVADRFFGNVIDHLGKAGLSHQREDDDGHRKFWRRVVIEKPFGHSLDSARALNAKILKTLHEDQIYRIDHFLGKEPVQSIMAFRFANGMFEPLWNRDHIDQIQITASETVGVELRGRFYEVTGALRDMVPNHLFALLTMVAMEPPTGFDAAAIRNKKAEVFAAMPAMSPHCAARGQYGAGKVLGKNAKAYRDEPDVDSHSNIETFVALRATIDNWRWAGVPFYMRTGKHLSARQTEIAIRFKKAPHTAFKDTPVEALRPNWLVLRITPNEGISLQFEVKRPGPSMDLAAVKMEFCYEDWFPKEPNVGYETLIYDVMIGDPTLFMRADMVEQAWRVVQPVLDAWANDKSQIEIYESGGDGPSCAQILPCSDGKVDWRPIGKAPEKRP